MLPRTCLSSPPRTAGALAPLALVVLVAGISAAAAPPVRTSLEPLPPHARLRLGTSRFRVLSEITAIALSPDGKTLAVADQVRLALYDTATGTVRRTLSSFRQSPVSVMSFCDQGRKLLAGGYQGLHVWDTSSGMLVGKWLPGARHGQLMSFSADGGRFAVEYAGRGDMPHQIVVRDLAGDREVARIPVRRERIPWAVLSPDGKRLAFGADPLSPVEIRGLGSSKGTVRFDADAVIFTARFSPDGKLLALAVGGWGGKPGLQVRDAATGKLRWKVPLAWFEEMTGRPGVGFGPLGRRVYMVADTGQLGIWESTTGKEVSRRGVKVSQAGGMDLLAGNRALAWGRKARVLQLWNPLTGKAITPDGGHREAVNALAFTADGKVLCVLDNEGRLVQWETSAGRVLEEQDLRPHLGGSISGRAAFTPDAGELVVPSFRSGMMVVDPATGKTRKKQVTWKVNLHDPVAWQIACCTSGSRFAAFPAPGGMASMVGSPVTPLFWDRRTAKSGEGPCVWFGADPVWVKGASFGALSPDGRRAAAATVRENGFRTYEMELTGWDLTTKRKLSARKLPSKDWQGSLCVAPDGRTAVVGGEGQLFCSDLLTGKTRGVIRGDWKRVTAGPLFSPDGRTLAIATQDTKMGPAIRLIEWSTQQERRCFRPEHASLGLAFSPDGRTLASGQQDTTLLLWDLTGRAAGSGASRTTPLARLWANLGSGDAAVSGEAIEELVDRPDAALTLLRARLKPAEALEVDPAAVRKAIARLDASALPEREAASRQLEEWRRAVEGPLRQALVARPNVEVYRRLERLLDALERPTKEEILHGRCVEALERIGSQEAKKLLHRMAGGDPLAVLTREARAALARLERAGK